MTTTMTVDLKDCIAMAERLRQGPIRASIRSSSRMADHPVRWGAVHWLLTQGYAKEICSCSGGVVEVYMYEITRAGLDFINEALVLEVLES